MKAPCDNRDEGVSRPRLRRPCGRGFRHAGLKAHWYTPWSIVTTVICLICGLGANALCGEWILRGSHELLSLDSVTTSISLFREDFGGRFLICSSTGDTIVIDDYIALVESKVVDKRFLVVHTREGRGKLLRTEGFHIICVFHGEMRTALLSKAKYEYHVPAEECGYDEDPNTDDYYLWEWAFELIGEYPDYSLKIVDRQSVTSKCILERNAMHIDSQTVFFSEQFGVFCNGMDTVSGEFGEFMVNFDGPWTHREKVVCPYIEVDLGTKRYFIDGAWCIQDENGRFLCGMGRDSFYDYDD